MVCKGCRFEVQGSKDTKWTLLAIAPNMTAEDEVKDGCHADASCSDAFRASISL